MGIDDDSAEGESDGKMDCPLVGDVLGAVPIAVGNLVGVKADGDPTTYN